MLQDVECRARLAGTRRHVQNAALSSQELIERLLLVPPSSALDLPLYTLVAAGLSTAYSNELLLCSFRKFKCQRAGRIPFPQSFEVTLLAFSPLRRIPGREYVETFVVLFKC